MRLIHFILFLFVASTAFAQKNYLLVGTYTTGKSIGIYVYDFNSKDGSAKSFDSIQTTNPSYLETSPDKKFVYAVNEKTNGNVSAFDFNDGHLSLINTQPSMGDDPCYITISKNQKWAIVANYSSGTGAVYPINKDGSLSEAVSVIKHYGHGTNMSRQQSPHIHSTVLSPDDKFLFVQDLGIDKIIEYSLNNKTGKLTPKDSVKLKNGSGPRHFIFHPNGKWAYLTQEMGGTITAFQYGNGKLKTTQTISVFSKPFKQYFTNADIHVSKDGRFLYASTRDSANIISVFKINPSSGRLTLVGQRSVLGKTPRNFNFDPSGNYLLVANQNSNDIIVFKVNRQTGLLTDTGKRINVGNPVCIKWIVK